MYQAWLDYVGNIPEDKQDKYRHSGIYGIWIEDKLVYIGKSKYMLRRICEHMLGINRNQKENKYKVLREAVNKHLKVRFDVLMNTDTEEETGYWEGVLIRQYAPELNYQIPRETDWRKRYANPAARTITLEEIME